jgi:hypothetical protein
MRLIPHWRRSLTHGYSTWIILAVAALHLVDFFGMMIAQYFPLWLSLPLLVAAIAAKLIKQKSVSGE